MTSPMPHRLWITAGSAESVRQQLGLAEGEVAKPLDLAQLPLSHHVRGRLQDWADTFVELHRSGGFDAAAELASGQQGIAVARELAEEVHQGVELRYLAGASVGAAAGRPFAAVVAGLFEDVSALPAATSTVGWTSYQSTLMLSFGAAATVPAPPAEPWLTAARTDATDAELGELRRRAVDPVIRSLLTPDELTSASVVVYQDDATREISVWLGAAGEEMRQWLWHPEYSAHSPDPVDVAAHLADSMEDWVCETRFAWGQHRIAVYEVLPPR